MPQVSAAVLRSAPSSTSASASIRRAAAPSFSRLAAARRADAVISSRPIATAAPIDAAPLSRASIEWYCRCDRIPYQGKFDSLRALERGAASMGAAVAIGRLDMTASALRAAASREKDGAAARRILALALVLDGADRKTAAETCGMDRQTLRDWVLATTPRA